MKSFRSRQVILLLIITFSMGAGSLLVAGSALADTALFRIEQSWLNMPNPKVTSPGNAGKYQGWIFPYVTKTGAGKQYIYPADTAIVKPNNPVGGQFTLPQSFIDYSGTFMITPKTGWPGYTTYYVRGMLTTALGSLRAEQHARRVPRRPPGYRLPDHEWEPVSELRGRQSEFPHYGGRAVQGRRSAPHRSSPRSWLRHHLLGRLCTTSSRIGSINVDAGTETLRRLDATVLQARPRAFTSTTTTSPRPSTRQYGHYTCFQNGDFGCTKRAPGRLALPVIPRRWYTILRASC